MLLSALFLVGCGSSDSSESVEEVLPIPYVIWDDDVHIDPDGMGTISLVLQMENQGFLKLLAIGLVGTDVYGRKSMGVSALTHYHNLPDMPIGLNTNTHKMRTGPSASSIPNPVLHGAYNGSYQDISQFDSDGCGDVIGCGTRKNVVHLYCDVLQNSPKKVSILTGGQIYNVAELLKETEYCNGMEVVREKVLEVVSISGRNGDHSNGQDFGGADPYALESFLYVIDHLPVPFIFAGMDLEGFNYQKIPNSRMGPLFQTHNVESPTAFVYSTKRYGWGIVDGHSYIDAVTLFHTVFGSDMFGNYIGGVRGVTVTKQSNGVKIDSSKPDGRHFERFGSNRDYFQHFHGFTTELLSANPNK